MIRLRKTDGSCVTFNAEEVPFVEIVNSLDDTVGLLFITLDNNAVMEVHPNTTDAARYEALMCKHGVKFATTTIHRKS
jgi:hypothetical protein